MATGVNVVRARVFPVTAFRRIIAPRRLLGEVARLPIFEAAGTDSWETSLALTVPAQKDWFLPAAMKSAVLNVYWYRETGGIPYQAVAAPQASKQIRSQAALDKCFVGLRKFRAHGNEAAANNRLQPAILTIPDSDKIAEQRSWFTQLIDGDRAAISDKIARKIASVMGRFR